MLIAIGAESVSADSFPKGSELEPHLTLQTLTLVICSTAGIPLRICASLLLLLSVLAVTKVQRDEALLVSIAQSGIAAL